MQGIDNARSLPGTRIALRVGIPPGTGQVWAGAAFFDGGEDDQEGRWYHAASSPSERMINMGGGRGASGYPRCTCMPRLDFLSKFHHIDRDIAFGPHKAEEIHHCTKGANDESFTIVHCGCPNDFKCGSCDRSGQCVAKVMHAVNREKITAALHLSFLEDIDLDKDLITVDLSEKCPNRDSYWHLDLETALFNCSLLDRIKSLIESVQNSRQQCAVLRSDAEWAREVKINIKRLFSL